MFHKNQRAVSLNSNYMVISKNPKDKNEDLEEKILIIFEKLEVTVDSSSVKDCQWPSNRTYASKIQRVKKMKGMNLFSVGIKTPVYINDSLCSCNKILW